MNATRGSLVNLYLPHRDVLALDYCCPVVPLWQSAYVDIMLQCSGVGADAEF